VKRATPRVWHGVGDAGPGFHAIRFIFAEGQSGAPAARPRGVFGTIGDTAQQNVFEGDALAGRSGRGAPRAMTSLMGHLRLMGMIPRGSCRWAR